MDGGLPDAGAAEQPLLSNHGAEAVVDRGAFADAVEKAVAHARAVGSASSSDVPKPAATMVADLADAIAALPYANEKYQKTLKELRFQAERLRRADRYSFQLARWIKEALHAAVDGLDAAVAHSQGNSRWIAAAREATAQIDKESGLAFQRARVQDAVRATVDAFLAVGRVYGDCP